MDDDDIIVLTYRLLIKAGDQDSREQAADRMAAVLNGWFTERPRQRPYPPGTLLRWSVHTEDGARS